MGSDNNEEENTCSLTTKKKWLTHKEAADYLGLSSKALYNLCSQGKIKVHKLISERRNRYPLSELQELFYS